MYFKQLARKGMHVYEHQRFVYNGGIVEDLCLTIHFIIRDFPIEHPDTN
jgi:hypothetical protein